MTRVHPAPVWFHYDLGLSPMIRAMYVGAYETYVVSLLRRLLKPGDVFVDVGANVGYLSAIAAGCISTSGRVLSFEPNPEVFAILQANRDLNEAYAGWVLFEVGLGSEETTGQLAASRDNLGWNSLVTASIPEKVRAACYSVEVRSLSWAMKEHAISRVKLVKIDVEGYESKVLAGMRDVLEARRIDNLIVEFCPPLWPVLGESISDCFADLQSFGYEFVDTQTLQILHHPRELPPWSPDIWIRLKAV